MDFFEAINQRYSYKHAFLPTPVPMEDLIKIADAGLKAPTGANAQYVSLMILDRDALDKLCGIVSTEGLRTAPAAILLMTDPALQKGAENFEVEDYAAAAENMLLAAVALDYASLWLDSPFFKEDVQIAAKALFSIPDRFHLRVILPVGYPAQDGSRREKIPVSKRLFLNMYGKEAL